MTLDRKTYEAWLLDRIEGRLTPDQERELDAFLAANPDLPVALGGLPNVHPDAPVFAAKDLLRKHFPPTGAPDGARLNDFLVARVEGTLSAEQEQQLDRFLYEHPEAARDAGLMAATRAQAGAEGFADKASIERRFPPQGAPDKHRLTDFLIAAQEGDLDAQQRAALQRYVSAHPEAAREERLVAAARVHPEVVVYADKAGLRKRDVRVVPLWTRLAAAASVLLLIGLGWWVLRNGSADDHRIARQDKAPVVPTTPVHVQPQQEGSAVPSTHEGPSGRGGVMPTGPKGTSAHDAAPLRGAAPAQRSNAAASSPVDTAAPVNAPPAVPEPSQAPEPALAQQPAPAPGAEAPALAQHTDAPATGGTPLATFVANTVREGVLDSPERNTALDRTDAVAMVDKGLNVLTGGTGGMQVQRTGTRERVQFRLGRHFAITASRGH